jgi:hypothetical protein
LTVRRCPPDRGGRRYGSISVHCASLRSVEYPPCFISASFIFAR